MQIPKSAIERAIEGGWEDFRPTIHALEPGKNQLDKAMTEIMWHAMYEEKIALDKTFWQALGKSLGWGTQHRQWLKHAHRFYDLILQDQPTDIFWKEILGDNN